MRTLSVLSAGAAQTLVGALTRDFELQNACGVRATFGPVGAVAARLRAGESADLVISSAAGLAALAAEGRLQGNVAEIGTVDTVLAIRRGDLVPPIGNEAELRAALLQATDLYLPDPALTTAGAHIAAILERLGIAHRVVGRIRSCPSGEAAVRGLAGGSAGSIGCAQATEAMQAEGVASVGPLPGDCRLSTAYGASLSAKSSVPDLASAFIDRLTGPDTGSERARAGFR